ncbi:hypothetical protein BJV78DRAFT_1200938 [Lactifluus subvellereus]|nr:hypothetical protein BJV78DRAFT_1200938 [Lactifluus subvellereus]
MDSDLYSIAEIPPLPSPLEDHQPEPQSPLPSTPRPRLHCPDPACGNTFAGPQQLKRHLFLLRHLPCCTYCPYWPCTWRGNHLKFFLNHLIRWECGPYPERKQREIYDQDTILEGILSGRYTVEEATRQALALVSEKARVLGLEEEWKDLWGRSRNRQETVGRTYPYWNMMDIFLRM